MPKSKSTSDRDLSSQSSQSSQSEPPDLGSVEAKESKTIRVHPGNEKHEPKSRRATQKKPMYKLGSWHGLFSGTKDF